MDGSIATRTAKIGLYSDRVTLSVEERSGGAGFCLYRKELAEDFLDEQGKAQREKIVRAAGELMEMARELGCCRTLCFGYGLLRYEENLREELQEKLGTEITAVSGVGQAKSARRAMERMAVSGGQNCGVGLHCGDMSSQVFSCAGGENWQESFPLGWRMVWQRYGRIVPDRLEEEEMRREINMALDNTTINRHRMTDRIRAAGFDEAARFVLLMCGCAQRESEELILKKEVFGEVLRMMRNPSLRWLGALEQAAGIFPQKVFCQLVILETVMDFLNASESAVCRVCLEDNVDAGACAPTTPIIAGT